MVSMRGRDHKTFLFELKLFSCLCSVAVLMGERFIFSVSPIVNAEEGDLFSSEQ